MELDIKERIIADFGRKASTALELVEAFEKSLKLSPRVTRSIVHLSKGDISKLRKVIKEAKTDWRDVISYAEQKDFEFNNPFNKRRDNGVA